MPKYWVVEGSKRMPLGAGVEVGGVVVDGDGVAGDGVLVLDGDGGGAVAEVEGDVDLGLVGGGGEDTGEIDGENGEGCGNGARERQRKKCTMSHRLPSFPYNGLTTTLAIEMPS